MQSKKRTGDDFPGFRLVEAKNNKNQNRERGFWV